MCPPNNRFWCYLLNADHQQARACQRWLLRLGSEPKILKQLVSPLCLLPALLGCVEQHNGSIHVSLWQPVLPRSQPPHHRVVDSSAPLHHRARCAWSLAWCPQTLYEDANAYFWGGPLFKGIKYETFVCCKWTDVHLAQRCGSNTAVILYIWIKTEGFAQKCLSC